MVGREGRFVVSIEEGIGALVDDELEKISIQGEAIGAHQKAGLARRLTARFGSFRAQWASRPCSAPGKF